MKTKIKYSRITLGILIYVTIFVALNFTSLHLSPEDKNEKDLLNTGLREIEEGYITAVNLGGSTAAALDFDDLKITGYSFAASNRDLSENEVELQEILKLSHGKVKKIFLNANPPSILFDNAWREPLRRRQFYRIMASRRGWMPIGQDWSNLILGRLLPLVRQDRWKGPITQILSYFVASPYLPVWTPPSVTPAPAPPENSASDSSRLTENSHFLSSVLSSVENNLYFDQNAPERNENALISMCKLAEKNMLKLYIYSTPTTDIYDNIIKPINALAQKPWEKAKKNCETHGAKFINLENSELFKKKYEYFEDTIHLNINGSHILSKIIRDSISED